MSKTAATFWATFKPPPLREAAALKAAVDAARRLSPAEVLRISIDAGIHNPDGTLTEKYRAS
jgi:hypothetical protein